MARAVIVSMASEPDVDTAAKWLRSAGYEVSRAAVRGPATPAELVVAELDFADPAEDARIIRDLSAASRQNVLVLSPSSHGDDVVLARDSGASAYLIEPYTEDQFAIAVSVVLERAAQ